VFHSDGYSGLTPETITSIADGTSNTIMVGERHIRMGGIPEGPRRGPFWANAFNLYQTSAAYLGINNIYLSPDYDACRTLTLQLYNTDNHCKYGWGSFHAAGIQFLYADGHVGTIPSTIDQTLFAALSTIAGGEVTPNQ
jgi:prepilin-type processing-associated H-X9-DG protein